MLPSRKEVPADPDPAEPSEIDRHVGRQIRVRRQLLGLTSEQLGRSLGLAQQHVTRHERGARVSASRLFAFSRALGVPIEFFFEGLEAPGGEAAETIEPAAPGPPSEAGTEAESRDIVALMRAYRRLSNPEDRKVVLDLIKRLAAEEG